MKTYTILSKASSSGPQIYEEMFSTNDRAEALCEWSGYMERDDHDDYVLVIPMIDPLDGSE